MKLGFAGKLAAAFVDSKLTPLIILASILLGVFALVKTPREEEPQIIVPMADVLVEMPGATAKDVERRVTTPMEKLVWEVPGVEYVYSTSFPGRAMVVVRFLVGQDQEKALVRLREKLQSNFDLIPPGASQPIIKPRSIDDVPVLALTLHSTRAEALALRQIAERVEEKIKSVPNVSETTIIGGADRELRVILDPQKLASFGLDSDRVLGAIGQANQQSQSGLMARDNVEISVKAGGLLRSADEVREVVVSGQGSGAIRVKDVAQVVDGQSDSVRYVLFGHGQAGGHGAEAGSASGGQLETAVTIAVSKRQGVNAIELVEAVLKKVETLKGTIVPGDVSVTVTRNYGATSAEKSNELLYHMGIAVVSVTILIALALGRRESMVVLIAIPVTLALTLLVFYLYGYTLNRITLFALIFSIGILVDDAIVVVENIVRHVAMPDAKENGLMKTAIRAVDEVGNPTILATFAVIAAILPLAFVGGLMGPYMRPIPVGASAAMLFSLIIAFVVTPWAAVRFLKVKPGKGGHGHDEGPEDWLTRLYRGFMTPMLRRWPLQALFAAIVVLLLGGAISLIGLKLVTVKMLPFDNKNEFQVIVDMPTGTTLEKTAAVARELADYGAKIPEVENYQIYIGASSPYNFNGLVRHYFMRSASYQADIQVNLVEKHHRKAQSHDIVRRIRKPLEEIAARHGARLKIAEVPPGPPVLETLVAEVYAADDGERLALAEKVKEIFQTTEGVAGVDWYRDDDQETVQYIVDQEKAALMGVSVDKATRALATALHGSPAGLLHDDGARRQVPIRARFDRSDRSGLDELAQAWVSSQSGRLVPLSEIVEPVRVPTDKAIYHKNLQPVIYITGDVVGAQESPVYAILKMNEALAKLKTPRGGEVKVHTAALPEDDREPSMKWDGEWHITYEVFRDLGIAFAAVLVLIYILVVAWFQNFETPLVIMAPIPLTLVGILPAHAMMGAFFTATSMIGFIAGAGIIVRNSIILVDFIELRRSEGASLEQAVVDAGAIRFRPMLLTAAAVIVGSFVILFDPIFQGLAVALMAGEIASTLLSRAAVPILYYRMIRKQERQAARKAARLAAKQAAS